VQLDKKNENSKMNKEINIKSSTIEKGLEIAKDFLGKLIMPAVEETGLLIKDQVTFWKFKNQVKILNKAQEYCKKHNIEPKKIQFKLLVPLIETSALEEDEILQDKWAILLSNMVDSEQNVENHVFPYILGQISKNEFLFIEQVYLSKKERVKKLEKELNEFIKELPKIKEKLQSDIKIITEKIEKEKNKESSTFNREVWKLDADKREIEYELSKLKYKELSLKRKIIEPEIIPYGELKEFEVSNLVRLGLIKETQETIANPQTLEIPNKREDEWEYRSEYVSVDVEIELETYTDYILTELGELFVKACTEKE